MLISNASNIFFQLTKCSFFVLEYYLLNAPMFTHRKKMTRLSVNANGSLIPKDFIDKNLIKKSVWWVIVSKTLMIIDAHICSSSSSSFSFNCSCLLSPLDLLYKFSSCLWWIPSFPVFSFFSKFIYNFVCLTVLITPFLLISVKWNGYTTLRVCLFAL